MNHWQLKQAARAIHQGGIIAYPTEAVYGLGCDPLNPDAVLRLLALKGRTIQKGLILLASDITQLSPFMAPLDTDMTHTLEASWPGPVTWLVPARADTPVWLKGQHDSIAVRVTSHPMAAALCQAVGHALVSTSANHTNQRPAKTPLQVRRYFLQQRDQRRHQQERQQLDRILVGSLGNLRKPTLIRDLISGHIIRPG